MTRRILVALLAVAVLVAGCPQGGDGEEPQLPGERSPTPATATPDPEPRETATPAAFTWSVSRVAGLTVTDTGVNGLAVVLASGAATDPLDVRNGTILLEHEAESYRFVHESGDAGSADGTFTVGPPGPRSVLMTNRHGRARVLVVNAGPNATGVPALEPGDSASLLVTTPTLTTAATELTVPGTLDTDVSVQLSGEFAELEREPERNRPGRPVLVSATAADVTADGAGLVNLTVTKLPGSAPVDYRNVTVTLAGADGFETLGHPVGNDPVADDHFGLTPVRDSDGSAPVLTDGDRFRLTLDLRTDAGDDPAGDSVDQRLARGEIALVQLTLDSGRTRFLRIRLPVDAASDTVSLDGIVPKSDEFPRTRQRPTLRIVSSDAQRVDGGDAITGFEVDVFKPPTAAPIDPRTLTLEVETPNGSYTLVHATENATTADGHFGIRPRFDLDFSAPVLDDDVDFARLQIDLGTDSYDSDDGPAGTSIGQNVPAGSAVTVTATTDDGVSTSRAYLVTERD